MINKKNIIVPVLMLTAILGAGAYGISKANADEGFGRTAIIEKIAQKFGLNKDEVQKVFDENREEGKKNMQANFEKRLDEAVQKGELTKEKKDLILKKKEEMRAAMENNRDKIKDMTPQERKTQFESHRAELEKWAKDNGIDLKYLMGRMGHGMGRGMGKGFHGLEK